MRFLPYKLMAVSTFLCALTAMSPIAHAVEPTDTIRDTPPYCSLLENSPYAGLILSDWVNSPFLAQNMSPRQCAAALCNFFVNEEATIDPLSYSIRKGWFIYTSDLEYEVLDRGRFYSALLKAANIRVYDPELYGRPYISPAETATEVMRYFGLCSSQASASEPIPMVEAISTMVAVKNGSYAMPEPELLSKISVEVEEEASLPVLTAVLEVPEPILEAFRNEGWTLVLGSSRVKQYGAEHNMTIGGLTSYSEKKIFLPAPASTVHEFGHFLDSYTDFTDDNEATILAEMEAATTVLSKYAQTNVREFFAEFFEYWICYEDNSQKMNELRQACPGTYEAMEQLEMNGWSTGNG